MAKKDTGLKLNVLLAKTDSLGTQFKNSLKDYITFFKKNQGAFQGQKNTYLPKDDSIDEPKRRGNVVVQSTVDEKLEYFRDMNTEYINSLFSQEATNASGNATAELIVDGDSWGTFTSLELLRLKSMVESNDFKGMYSNIPVRSDAAEWANADEESYAQRSGVFEMAIVEYDHKTTEKEDYILEDPNVKHLDGASYSPQVATKNTTRILGTGTYQVFSGEWSHRQRALAQSRLNTLQVAVIEALKKANDCDVVESTFTADKLFSYLNQE